MNGGIMGKYDMKLSTLDHVSHAPQLMYVYMYVRVYMYLYNYMMPG